MLDGTATLNYASNNFANPPKLVFVPKLTTASDIPVHINIVGNPTATSAVIQVRRLTSILSLGLVPQYTGVSGIVVDVYVRTATS